MTLSTLDTNQILRKYEKNSNRQKTYRVYVAVTLFCCLFSYIYEKFSHGVYSDAMVYLFAYPLIGGVLVFGTLALVTKIPWPGRIAYNLYHDGVATLTVGSCIQGVLEIYGTTSKYVVLYRYAGCLLVAAGISFYIYENVRKTK